MESSGLLAMGSNSVVGLALPKVEATGHYRHPPPLSNAVVKCIFPVQAKKTFRLELFAPPVSVHFSVQLS